MRVLLLISLLSLPSACARADGNSATTITRNAAAQSARIQPPRSDSLAASRRTAIVEAANRVSPSVVSIHVTARQRVSSPAGLWDLFFVPRAREQLVQSFGTGFVLRGDGVIVTNQHVVAAAESVTVSLPDGSEVDATVIGEDPTTDIAVLRIDRQNLPVPPLGRSDDLLIGEWVVALGNPYTYLLGNAEPTVTAGVVSGLHRNILPNRDQTGLYLDMIQTDAAINPGNSGGPLTNALGEVIGMNSSILSSTGSSIGLGFAIPIERVRRVADEVIRNGTVRRPWAGLEVAGPEAMADWKSRGGVAVTRVAPGGPAEAAGLREGSVLVEANRRTLRNFLDWEATLLDLRVGDPIEIRVLDRDRSVVRRLVTGDLPTVTATRVSVLAGLELVTVSPAVQSERGLRATQGALVVRITDEIARETGLRDGDVLLGVNRTPITSAQEAARLLQTIRPRQLFRLYFERNGQVGYTDLSFR